VGETARTGVHGANRLASNSLLEAAVFADRAARSLGHVWPDGATASASASPSGSGVRAALPAGSSAGTPGRHAGGPAAGRGASADSSSISAPQVVDREALQALMWKHVGLERDAAGLAAASARLDRWHAPDGLDRRSAEDRNLLDLARLTVAAALARTESIGAHFRTDEAGTTTGAALVDAASATDPRAAARAAASTAFEEAA
jgi:L-aspartate oxidase